MKILSKYLRAFKRFLQETLADIDNLVENIKKVDPEKDEIIHEFIKCLIKLYDGIGKETKLHIFHKKWLNDEDYDTVNKIMEELRQAKISFFF